MMADKKPPAGAGQALPGVRRNDHIFVHIAGNARSGRVLAHGKDGATVQIGGSRHQVAWEHVKGFKRRTMLKGSVVEVGEDGSIIQESSGKRVFVAGFRPPDHDPPAEPAVAKAFPLILIEPDLLKAIKDRPGLTLKPVTTKTGVQTKRWSKTSPDVKKVRKKAAAGDSVRFRLDGADSEGEVVSSGKDGAMVRDSAGKEHAVTWARITGHKPKEAGADTQKYPDRNEGEADKPYLKRVKDQLEDPKHMPEDHARYFNMDGAKTVPMDKLVSSKSDEENEKGGNSAPKFMMAAYHGKVAKRDPISVSRMDDGRYKIEDGNGTYTGVKKHGWTSLPVKIIETSNGPVAADNPKADPAPLFSESETGHLPKNATQPQSTEEDIYREAEPALDHLKNWLNKGHGICDKLGFKTMGCAPEDVDWAKSGKGGMLFIAPLKSTKRAREKVEKDYKGN